MRVGWKGLMGATMGIVALVLLAAATAGLAGAVRPNVTYTVAFTESGLPSGTSWGVSFNGATTSSTTATVSISGVSGGSSYYWTVATVAGTVGYQYVATPSSGYMAVNSQLSQIIVFQKQDLLTFATGPSSTYGSVNPGGSGYYNNGSSIVVNAIPSDGYAFTSWKSSSAKDTFTNKSLVSTTLLVGAASTITANFKALTYKVTFTEQGLPASTIWSVVFNGLTYNSATTTLTAGSSGIGNFYWTVGAVSGGTGIQYLGSPSGQYMYVPYQTTQTIEFVKQYAVTFAVSPSGTGSTSPSGTNVFYTAGSEVAVSAYAYSGDLFSSWSATSANIHFGSKSTASTNVTINGTGTITAHTTTGTQCSTSCAATFTELGLPSGTSWAVTYGGVTYSSTTSTISISSATAQSWSAMTPIASSPTLQFAASPSSGYLSIPGQTVQEILYLPVYYVSFSTIAPYGGGSTPYASNGWYYAGTVLPVASSGSPWTTISKWSTSSASLLLSSTKGGAVFVTIKGSGTVTATFVNPTSKVEFLQTGLPIGTVWGVTFNGIGYTSSGWALNISGVPAYNGIYWTPLTGISAGTAGTEYQSLWTYGYLTVPYQPLQVLEYNKFVSVTITASGGGSTTPSGTYWYPYGAMFAISAVNGTSVHFTSWSKSPAAAVTFGAGSKATTTATVTGGATITGNFA